MAACGASDSVFTHTSVSWELQVPLLLFSVSLHGGFCSTDSCFYSQHNIIHSALPQSREDCRGADTGWPNVMRMERNGKREALRNLFSHFAWERWCSFNISPQNRREGTFHIHQSCTHIYLIYISTHPAVLFWKKKDNSAKHVLVVAWLQLFFLPFMVSAKHSGLKWGEKSDDPFSFKI